MKEADVVFKQDNINHVPITEFLLLRVNEERNSSSSSSSNKVPTRRSSNIAPYDLKYNYKAC